jgi:hypothetical protein
LLPTVSQQYSEPKYEVVQMQRLPKSDADHPHFSIPEIINSAFVLQREAESLQPCCITGYYKYGRTA